MAKRRRFSGTPEEHRAEARDLVKMTRSGAKEVRRMLALAVRNPRKRMTACASALDYMTGMYAAKGAAYRERIGAHGFKRKGFSQANRATDSLKHKFRQVCLKHPRSSKSGHW
jgi:hypothetical protein